MLLATDLTYREVAEGAGVGFEWLNKFSRRQIRQPGLDKIEPLHDFLVSHVASSSTPSGPGKLTKSSNKLLPANSLRKSRKAMSGAT